MRSIKILSVVAVVLLAISCNVENIVNVPDALKEKLSKEHPNSKDVEWEKEGDNYEAEFEEDGIEISIIYDSEGNLIAKEVEIEIKDLPEPITNYILENYIGYDIEEAEKIENNDGVYYEVEIENGDKEIELLFDSEGNFIEEEIENEEADEEVNEKEINISDLPQIIKDSIQNKYPGSEIIEADEITNTDGSITYDIEIKYNDDVIEVMYDSKGNFLGIESDDDDDD
jgi:uncharacterized membrane protein YkoI